jgi:hypothetical protein
VSSSDPLFLPVRCADTTSSRPTPTPRATPGAPSPPAVTCPRIHMVAGATTPRSPTLRCSRRCRCLWSTAPPRRTRYGYNCSDVWLLECDSCSFCAYSAVFLCTLTVMLPNVLFPSIESGLPIFLLSGCLKYFALMPTLPLLFRVPSLCLTIPVPSPFCADPLPVEQDEPDRRAPGPARPVRLRVRAHHHVSTAGKAGRGACGNRWFGCHTPRNS